MKPFLIAECGNCHEGNLSTAINMIQVAADCGADAVKFQAFEPIDLRHGSMPKEFYEMCQLSVLGCNDLLVAGQQLKIPVYFSIFSPSYNYLRDEQPLNKFAAVQVSPRNKTLLENYDNEFTFFSVKEMAWKPNLVKAIPMHVSRYLANNPRLENIDHLRDYYAPARGGDVDIGYSDHTEGIDWAIESYESWGALYIEKHFTLKRDIAFQGKMFRDAVHSALPSQFYELAKRIK